MAGIALLELQGFPDAFINSFGTASFSLSLAVNIILTALIAGRIWYLARGITLIARPQSMHKSSSGAIPAFAREVIAMMIESGALFAAVQLCFVITFAQGGNSVNIANSVAMQIYVRSVLPG